MNFADSGCKSFDVEVGQQVRITNKPRNQYNLEGKIIKIDQPSRLMHVGNIRVQFDDHAAWFCTCELGKP